MRKALHQTFHQPVSTRIDILQVAHLGKGVSTVTASSSGYLHLRQYLPGLLEDSNLHLLAHLLKVDGEEEPSSTSADYCRPHFLIVLLIVRNILPHHPTS